MRTQTPMMVEMMVRMEGVVETAFTEGRYVACVHCG